MLVKCCCNMASVKFQTFFWRSSPRDIMKSGRGLEKLSSVFSNSPLAKPLTRGMKWKRSRFCPLFLEKWSDFPPISTSPSHLSWTDWMVGDASPLAQKAVKTLQGCKSGKRTSPHNLTVGTFCKKFRVQIITRGCEVALTSQYTTIINWQWCWADWCHRGVILMLGKCRWLWRTWTKTCRDVGTLRHVAYWYIELHEMGEVAFLKLYWVTWVVLSLHIS